MHDYLVGECQWVLKAHAMYCSFCCSCCWRCCRLGVEVRHMWGMTVSLLTPGAPADGQQSHMFLGLCSHVTDCCHVFWAHHESPKLVPADSPASHRNTAGSRHALQRLLLVNSTVFGLQPMQAVIAGVVADPFCVVPCCTVLRCAVLVCHHAGK